MSNTEDKVRVNAIQCITNIEDFFEYHYRHYTVEEIKEEIMRYIDEFTDSLDGQKEE